MSVSVSPQVQDANTKAEDTTNTAPVSLSRILVALDASDHANRALDEAVRLGATADAVLTGIHAYAAQLHDARFRMMEGGLPERYHEESEMMHQREVHDDLITRGLDIISDSYHDAGQLVCDAADLPYNRLSPEGKNYACVVKAAGSGDYDLLVLGALGLGAVPGSQIGTVCERTVRRSPIDVLVIRDPVRAIGDGPIVVALDGSAKSYGVLKTGLDLGRRLDIPVHAVAAFDPYYHYVAFNKISQVLSEEAGKIFRFDEQEKLHEELIDDGLARIYQSHLDVARTIATGAGADLECELLDGKPYRAILSYIDKVGASLLMVGKTGVHGDADLDIGGNAENLLRNAACHVWIGQGEHMPEVDIIAEETTTWSTEAEAFISRAPGFVQDMARKAVVRYAHSEGHTFITSDLVSEVMGKMMPGMGSGSDGDVVEISWTDSASALLEDLEPSVAEAVRLRAEKRARREGVRAVSRDHVIPFLETEPSSPDLTWAAAALARLARVPKPVRMQVRDEIEDVARETGAASVSLEIAETAIVEIRKAMCPVPEDAE